MGSGVGNSTTTMAQEGPAWRETQVTGAPHQLLSLQMEAPLLTCDKRGPGTAHRCPYSLCLQGSHLWNEPSP